MHLVIPNNVYRLSAANLRTPWAKKSGCHRHGQPPVFTFADQTNKHETYGGGRFLDAPGPDASRYTYLDFNKATNPPCAFTPYATCPTLPKKNKLAVAIAAVEK